MLIKISIKNHIDVMKNVRKLQNEDLWLFAAQTWHKLYSPFIPMQTGNLMEKVTIAPKTIQHNAPYAKRNYEGYFNFRTDKHPRASRKWDKAAEPTQKPKIIKSIQSYIDSGKLRL